MGAADIPPKVRVALHVALFNEWVHLVPSVMERAAMSREALEERERRAADLAEQMARLTDIEKCAEERDV
jgi:hypothetical protein